MSAPTDAELRLIGSLKDYVGGRESVSVETGQTVRQALAALGIRPEIVALVIVNGTQQPKDYVLKSGDSVEVLAVIGGGEAGIRDRGWGGAPCGAPLRTRSAGLTSTSKERREENGGGECGLSVLAV
jgi:sulfur carrier protein ThiS